MHITVNIIILVAHILSYNAGHIINIVLLVVLMMVVIMMMQQDVIFVHWLDRLTGARYRALSAFS